MQGNKFGILTTIEEGRMDDLGSKTKNRKQDHININLNEDVMSSASTGFDLYYFEHNALPDLDLSKIEINCSFLGKPLKAPLLISSMTGGTEEGLKININLATAAQELGVPMGLGSQRVGLESNETYKSFNLRKWAPSIPIYANLGAIQLNYGYGIDECRRIVEMAQADALILHLNPLQEALQSEGQSNLLKRSDGVFLVLQLKC
jgi:isopentenyl-diphosphate delta-isomerase